MNETDYNARLYEKMKAEQGKYRDRLQYTEKSYFDYLFENRLTRLKEIMGKNELAASDQILEQFYEGRL